MGLLDWLRGNRLAKPDTGLAPIEHYPTDEKRILLSVAAQIRDASGKHMQELMAVTVGLGSTIAALRKNYGLDVVEVNCPAEQIVNGYTSDATNEQRVRANKLFDDLVRDLHAFEGDEYRTWARMVWM